MTDSHTLKVHTPSGKATLVLSRNGRKFTVVSFEVDDNPDLSLAFAPAAPGFENLDETSDIAQCLNLSSRVRYGDVILDSLEMRANSIDELEYALKRAKVRAYNHEEI